MKNKINKGAYQPYLKMHRLSDIPDDLIRFSFKYINFSEKYPLKENDDNYFKSLFNRLQSISHMKTIEFRTNKEKGLRAHKHDWPNTSDPGGFSHLNDKLKQAEAWQFQLSSAHGRVHGILVDDVFYIIWLGPHHNLYS